MKIFLLILFVVFFSHAAFSQNGNTLKEDNPVVVQDRLNKLNSINGANSLLLGFDNRSSEVVGDAYLFEDWVPASITFSEGAEVQDLPVNVDLLNQRVEIKAGNQVKVAYAFQVRDFVVKNPLKEDTKFISLNDLRLADGEKLKGFGQLLYDGQVKLVKRPYVSIKKAKYIPGFEVGSLNPEIVDKEKFYLLQDKVLTEVKRKPGFGKHNAQMKKYMKENKLKTKREKDLVEIVAYYNSLLP